MTHSTKKVPGPEAKKQAEIDAAWDEHNRTAPNAAAIARRKWLEKHLEAQQHRCAYCGILIVMDSKETARSGRATIDHIVPMAKGGGDSFENTIGACQQCNTAKADLAADVFLRSDLLKQKRALVNTPPDRVSVEPSSEFYDQDALARGIGIIFNGRERRDVLEYCISEKWIVVPAGRSRDRHGRPMAIKLRGDVHAYFSGNRTFAEGRINAL